MTIWEGSAMTIKQLHYFIAVAETKSFTHAARNYYIAQTAMSQQISSLEKELGFLLFRRTNRMVELTEAGKLLYEKVRPLVLELERAVEQASTVAGIQEQVFRIGIYDQAINRFLAPALREFASAEPEVVPLLVSDNQQLLLEGLAAQRLDVLVLGRRYYTPRSALQATELFSYQVLNYVLAVPEDHPLAEKEAVVWSDLNGLDLIAYNPFREDQQSVALRAALQEHSVTANILLSIRDVSSALIYVEAGIGCCLLPPQATEQENLQVRFLPVEEGCRDTMLLLSHKDTDNHLVARFTAICKKSLHGT
jgi:DNA-binding transcriptional LysR family regulator